MDNPTNKPSILASLRALVPARPLRFSEALRLTELQAMRLRELLGITTFEITEDALLRLPRIKIIDVPDLPTSAVSQWSDGRWVVAINGLEPWQRQRFSLGHELWHIINHSTSQWLCPPDRFTSTTSKAEQLADFFSGCLLMPRPLLKRLVGEGSDAATLAEMFGVSLPAVAVRLAQTGLARPVKRCGHSPSIGVAA